MLTSGKIYAACLPPPQTTSLIQKEWNGVFGGKPEIEKFRENARRELKRKGYTTIIRSDLVGYVSIAAAGTDWKPGLHARNHEPGADERSSESAAGQRRSRDAGRRRARRSCKILV